MTRIYGPRNRTGANSFSSVSVSSCNPWSLFCTEIHILQRLAKTLKLFCITEIKHGLGIHRKIRVERSVCHPWLLYLPLIPIRGIASPSVGIPSYPPRFTAPGQTVILPPRPTLSSISIPDRHLPGNLPDNMRPPPKPVSDLAVFRPAQSAYHFEPEIVQFRQNSGRAGRVATSSAVRVAR